jgi:DNA polymerase-1
MNGDLNGGTLGFLRSLGLFVRLTHPDKIIIVWDGAGGSKKRRAIIKDYKEGRKPLRLNRSDLNTEDSEDNKRYQRIRLAEYMNDLPVYQLSISDVEADDVIGYLVRMFPNDEKVIVSSDKDFFQLVGDKVSIYSPIKKDFLSAERIFQDFGVYPANFAIARAIVGDPSDNLKGIKGVAFKKLIKLFPFMTKLEKVTLDQLFEYCEQQGEKYKRFVDEKQIIIDNHKVMQLEEPIIGFASIHKIEESLAKDVAFNATSFRIKSYQDGVTTFNDSFFMPFRIIATKKGQ